MRAKLKTHRGAAKRFKVTATGKVMQRRAGKRHLLTSKSAKRKRALGKLVPVHSGDARIMERLLPYKR